MTRKQIGAVCGAILLAVITPLLVLGLLHGLDGRTQAAPAASFTGPHYKTYDIFDDLAPPVGVTVDLVDQFVTQSLQVGPPYYLSAPAIKTDGDTGEYLGGDLADPHLKCYGIVGEDPDVVVNITTQFGTETDVDVGEGQLLCIPTLKEVTFPDPVPPPPPPVPLEPHYVCYTTAPATPPPGLIIDLETQFGTEADVQFSTTIPGGLCAPALKNGDGNLDAPHLRCYGIDQGSDPPHIVNLFTQFDPEYDVEVNAATWMCVPAVKEIVQPGADVHYRQYILIPGGPSLGVTVTLETQFGIEEVVVQTPERLWAPALKTIPPDPPEGDLTATHLKQYTIDSDENPPYTVNLTNQFGTHQNVEVGAAWGLLVPAAKEVTSPTYVPPGPLVPAPHYKCYWISPPDLTIPQVSLETQFGLQTGVDVLSAEALCAPAIKTIPPGPPEGDLSYPHLVAYDINPVEDPPHVVNLETQFGFEYDVDVGPSYYLLVPTEKEIVEPGADVHYRQYDITGPHLGEIVDIETQFGIETDVYVAEPLTLNAPALKTIPPGPPEGDLTATHLKEYAIFSSEDPDVIVNLTNQFGTEQNVEVGLAITLLVPAAKEVTFPESVPPGPLETAPHYKCYYATGTLHPPTVDIETQFGTYASVDPDPMTILCAPAIKTIPPGPPEGDLSYPHLACYPIPKVDPPHIVNLETQFGFEYDVDVGDGTATVDWLCVPTEKEIVGAEADKEVIDIEFQDPTGLPIDPPEIEILKSQDYTISVTSVEYNWGPDQPVDAEISFFANIPAGCEGQWVLDPANWADILTVDGNPSIPSSGTQTVPGMVAGLRTVDLHFQTLEYGIDEPPQETLSFTRDFELHCSEADAFNYVFTFCNRADVKAPDTDPDPLNNIWCEDLFVTSLHNADIKSVSWSAPSPVGGTVGVPFTITVDEDKHNNGPQPADSDVTWTATAPAQVTAVWVDSGTSVLNFTVDLTSISANLPVSRNLQITCNQAGGPYTITLDTAEQPIDPATGAPWVDPVPGNNNDTTNVDVNCTEAGAEEIKWAQMPDDSPWGLDVSAYEPFVLAEDFLCNESGLITKIDFWASWFGDAPPEGDPNAVAFILSLHSDVPAGVDLPWSHPGETLWMQPFDPYDCTAELWGMGEEGWLEPPDMYIPFADNQIWLYSCPIPQPSWFQQEEGTIYWLDVQAFPLGPGMFGWKTSFEHHIDDGVWAIGAEPIDPLDWFELVYPPGHPLWPESIDLSFQLWGQECDPLLDSDGDGFNDAIECYLPTDRNDDCTNGAPHDAWPLDINMDAYISVVGDVLEFRGHIGAGPLDPGWLQRLDLNMDSYLSVVGDVLIFRGNVGTSCT